MKLSKNKPYKIIHFVIFITILMFLSQCTTYEVTKIKGSKIGMAQNMPEDDYISSFIAPYRLHINNDLDSILAYNPENLDKSKGKWETNIGNLMADICLAQAQKLMLLRFNETADICLLNHGGIRNIIPKGNISARNAFEVMPFENSLVVLKLSGERIYEMAQYFVAEKRAHPLAGMEITIAQDTIQKIDVQGKPLETNKYYHVTTSDYLAEGGDRMFFFKSPEKIYDLDYKIRAILIDHFKTVDTLTINTNPRILIQ